MIEKMSLEWPQYFEPVAHATHTYAPLRKIFYFTEYKAVQYFKKITINNKEYYSQ